VPFTWPSVASGDNDNVVASGQNSLPVCVYDASVAFQAGVAVTRVVLLDVSSAVASGSPSLHIFAVTIQ
jgi:hypothetical protein